MLINGSRLVQDIEYQLDVVFPAVLGGRCIYSGDEGVGGLSWVNSRLSNIEIQLEAG